MQITEVQTPGKRHVVNSEKAFRPRTLNKSYHTVKLLHTAYNFQFF